LKIVARIEELTSNKYLFDGRVFDSFVSARLEMTQQSRHLIKRPTQLSHLRYLEAQVDPVAGELKSFFH
jgi:hypothetical protein